MEVETYPAPRCTRLIQEDEDEGSPDGSKEADQADNESEHHALGDQVAETLGLQETRIRITLHGLEDIVFGGVEQLGVCSLLGAFNGVLYLCQDALRNDDLPLRSWEEICVQDFLGGGAQVLSPWLGVVGG
jgi:hypothetical protein